MSRTFFKATFPHIHPKHENGLTLPGPRYRPFSAQMTNPYKHLPPSAFWRTGVAELSPLAIRDIWTPKYQIRPDDSVATAGSCFAQHIGRALAARGYNWFDAEPGPTALSAANRARFNYGIFSFRTANIYTSAMLRQWIEWALKKADPPEEIWEEGGRFFDPFRPSVEPDGFESADELLSSRAQTLKAIARAVEHGSVFTFTLGLTEAWRNLRHGHVYAACPGTLHGTFDAAKHGFHNFTPSEILGDLTAAFDLAREANPDLRILLTVSPVPLVATASGKHVLVASTYSKSVLRAAAGEYADGHDYADYFPSYELIATAPSRAMFYEPNLRSVSNQGVDFVMDMFFRCMQGKYPPEIAPEPKQPAAPRVPSEDEIVCEEEILEQFNEA